MDGWMGGCLINYLRQTELLLIGACHRPEIKKSLLQLTPPHLASPRLFSRPPPCFRPHTSSSRAENPGLERTRGCKGPGWGGGGVRRHINPTKIEQRSAALGQTPDLSMLSSLLGDVVEMVDGMIGAGIVVVRADGGGGGGGGGDGRGVGGSYLAYTYRHAPPASLHNELTPQPSLDLADGNTAAIRHGCGRRLSRSWIC